MLTLETSKKLKEAGWCVVTEFYYYVYVNYQDDWDYKKISSTVAGASLAKKHYYPCPSLEELLVVMPRELHIDKPNFHVVPFILDRKTILWRCGYIDTLPHYLTTFPTETFIYMGRHEDPTEAVAQLWLKLKAEKLI